MTKLYRGFADLIKNLLPPDGGVPGYYLERMIWQDSLFTNLFLLMLALSLISVWVYYSFLNGKRMPAIYNKRKHWYRLMLVAFMLNFFGVAIFLWLKKIPTFTSNHFYCTALANALFGVIVFSLVSFLYKRFSNSAKRIPF